MISKKKKEQVKLLNAERKKLFETIMNLAKDELPKSKILIFEWSQGKNSYGRKKPSLWSCDINSDQKNVEGAVADLFYNEGWNASHSGHYIMYIFALTEGLARLGVNRSQMDLFFNMKSASGAIRPRSMLDPDRKLHEESDRCRLDEIETALTTIPSAPREVFLEYLPQVLEGKLNDYRLFVDHGGFSPPGGDAYYDLSADEKSETVLASFCERFSTSSVNIESAKNAMIGLYDASPKQLWQNANLLNDNRSDSGKGSDIGFPDLLIWRGNEYRLIEVKTENDSLQQSQAFFYSSVAKNLAMNMQIGEVFDKRSFEDLI